MTLKNKNTKSFSITTLVVVLFVGLFFLPVSTDAIRCNTYDSTVVFVNGIFTDEGKAKENKKELERSYSYYFDIDNIEFALAHNPSHIAGLGDLTQTYYQIVGQSISSFDLQTMLMQLQKDVATQKVLLVGHSQGTFYTNEIYEYLIKNGLPESAVSVYNIATPANYVAGNGRYLTSANDNLINEVRIWAAGLNANQPLEANALIPLSSSESSLWSGHSFREEYLAGASVQIVSDINKAIESLKSRDTVVNPGGCFNSPKKNLSYRLKQGSFAVLDNSADIVLHGGKAVKKSAIATTKTITKALAGVAEAVDDVFTTTIENTAYKNNRSKVSFDNFGASAINSTREKEEPVIEEVVTEPEPVVERVAYTPPSAPAPEPVIEEVVVVPSIPEATPEPVIDEAVIEDVVVETETPSVSEPSEIRFQDTLYAIPEIAKGKGGGGGGGGGGGAPAADTTAPDSPVITAPSDFSVAFSTTTLSFSGTAEADSTINLAYTSVDESVTTDGDGNWVFSSLLFAQGTTTVSLTATDSSSNTSSATTVDVGVDTLPDAPVITTPTSDQSFATTSITFIGTATSSIEVLNDFDTSTTTSDGSGNWVFDLSGFPEGTTTVGFSVTDIYGMTSSTSTVDVYVDTTAPTLNTFSVLECDYSLNSSSCLAGGSPINLSWSSSDTDISYYSIVQDGVVVATTTDTSTTLSLTDATYSIEVAVYDALGNGATSTAQSVEIDSRPIVINEIAWAGTQANADDEWIELYNTRSDTVELSNVVILASDGSPYITLSGTVAANSYYLIERDDSTATSESEDMTPAFGDISNTGEVLTLVHVIGTTATTTLDETPSLADCSGAWCGGEASTTPISMERINSSVSGAVASNWSSNDTYAKNGTDADSNIINGTPKSRNSVSINDIGYYCDPYTSTYTEGGYYTPTSGTCYYESASFPSGMKRYGGVYKGTMASSTIVVDSYLRTGDTWTVYGDDLSLSSPAQGDQYFTAIYETTGSNAHLNEFRDFFQTGSAPPSLDYGIIHWVYGTAP